MVRVNPVLSKYHQAIVIFLPQWLIRLLLVKGFIVISEGKSEASCKSWRSTMVVIKVHQRNRGQAALCRCPLVWNAPRLLIVMLLR